MVSLYRLSGHIFIAVCKTCRWFRVDVGGVLQILQHDIGSAHVIVDRNAVVLGADAVFFDFVLECPEADA